MDKLATVADGDIASAVTHYRGLALEAEEAAAGLQVGKYREAYLVMAKHWLELAASLESLLCRSVH